MKATLQVELQEFQVPDFVNAVSNPLLKQQGMQELPRYPLSDLDAGTLDALCAKFRSAVFKKAGKNPPPTSA